MRHSRVLLAVAVAAVALAGIVAWSATGQAQQPQTIKIGTLYDHSGPFSAAGSRTITTGAGSSSSTSRWE